MAVKLSQLRVSADMDASGYAGGMAQKVAADERGIASGEALGQSLAKQDVAAGNAGGTLGRLSRTYIDGYGSAAKFQTAVNSLQKQVELGNVSGDKAALIYQGMVKQFGMVASAAEIAGRGNADFAKIVGDVNGKVNTNVVALGQQRTATGLQRYELINLSRQLQDVGVSLVSGQSPFTVMVQQGTQIADVFANTNGSVRGFFRQAIGGIASVLTPLNLLVAGTIAVGVAAYAMNAAWKASALQFDDTARAIGSTIQNVRTLSSEASARGIANFAEEAGRFAGSIYEARDGMGSLGALLRANGERPSDFNGTLEAVARILQRASNDQQRLQLLQQAGLPATMQWVRFLQNGGEAIRQASDEAAKMSPREQDLIDKAREFDERWNRAWNNFEKSGIDAFIRIKAGLNDVNDLLDKLSIGKLQILFALANPGAAIGRIAGDLVSGGLARLGPALRNPTLNQDGTLPGSSPLGRGLRGEASNIPWTANTAPAVDPVKQQRELQLEQQRIQMLGDLATVADKVRLKEIEIQQARANGVTVTKEAEKALLSFAAAQEQAARAQATVSALGSAATVAEQYDAKLKALQATLASGAITQETFNRAVAGLKNDQYLQSLQDTISALGDAAPATLVYQQRVAELQQMLDQGRISQETFNQAVALSDPLLKTVYDTTSRGLTTALTDVASGAKSAGDAFRSFGQMAVRAIEEMIIKLYVIEPLMRGLGGWMGGFGGLFGGIGGGTGWTGVEGGTGLPGFGGLYASGGRLAGGRWGIVGENGPELIEAHAGGGVSIYSNDQSSQMMGGLASATGFANDNYSAPNVIPFRTPAAAAGGSGDAPVYITYAPVYSVTGTTADIDALRAEIVKDRREFKANAISAIREARSRKIAV